MKGERNGERKGKGKGKGKGYGKDAPYTVGVSMLSISESEFSPSPSHHSPLHLPSIKLSTLSLNPPFQET